MHTPSSQPLSPATANPGAPSGLPPEIRIELRSNPLYLAGVRELLGTLAKRLGFSTEAGGQIALAVDEALCNVIRHGYGKAADRPIWLSVWPEGGSAPSVAADCASTPAAYPDALRIVIEDEGKQVDPATIRSRDLEEIRPGGLGVHIIQTVMDEARFEKRENRGMRLVMVKKRVGGKSDQNSASLSGGCPAGPSCCSGSGESQASRPRR